MLRWPVFAHLKPDHVFRLFFPDGDVLLQKDCAERVSVRPRSGSTMFDVFVLPDELALCFRVRLPHLSDADIDSALSLQVSDRSPFPPDDTSWGWWIDSVTEQGLDLLCAVCSTQHVISHLSLRSGWTGRGEVWAAMGSAFVPIRGFGEKARLNAVSRYRRRAAALVVFVAIMIAAIPALHFAQIRASVFDAQAKLGQMQRQAAPFVSARDRLTTLSENASNMRALLELRMDPIALLNELTDLLPDDAYLVRLDIDGRKVRVAGQAKDAAALMESLRAHERFVELRAIGPIIKGRAGLDVFNLEFVVNEPMGSL